MLSVHAPAGGTMTPGETCRSTMPCPARPNRKLSERCGLKVYLCLEHHTQGPEAVHNNIRHRLLVQRKAQEAFEAKYSHEKWMDIFGRNFI